MSASTPDLKAQFEDEYDRSEPELDDSPEQEAGHSCHYMSCDIGIK